MKIFPLPYLTILRITTCIASYTNTIKDALRIIGGRNATEDEFPFVVRLMIQTQKQENLHICTGAALNSKWTLTAGHCIDLMNQYKRLVRPVIAYHPSPKSELAYSDVVSMVQHPGMNLVIYKNDIGLVHTQPVQLTKYAKLSAIDYASLNGHQVSVVGYGMFIFQDSNAFPKTLQVLDVVVKQCSGTFLYSQMCFARACSLKGSVHGIAACPGDSGGPVVHASGIVAVNSFGSYADCGVYKGLAIRRTRYDVGYTVVVAASVSLYVDWISSHTNS